MAIFFLVNSLFPSAHSMLLEKRTAAVVVLQAFARHLQLQGRIFRF
ncbi:hypothetical protein [Nostoc sp.]